MFHVKHPQAVDKLFHSCGQPEGSKNEYFQEVRSNPILG
jgi:hypothetical protein